MSVFFQKVDSAFHPFLATVFPYIIMKRFRKVFELEVHNLERGSNCPFLAGLYSYRKDTEPYILTEVTPYLAST